MFRTGDLVSRDLRGQIRFIGRKDTQIKLRGYRIELGEIERVLAQHPQITSAVVACIESEPLQKVLAASVLTTADGVQFDALKRDLQRQLPDYMIPTLWRQVEAFPLRRTENRSSAVGGHVCCRYAA